MAKKTGCYPVTIRVENYEHKLAKVSRAPRSDVRHLLAYCLSCSAAEIRPEMSVSAQQYQQFDRLFARCVQGEPLAYVIGEWDFWGITLHLRPGVLIPRADTECLVEAVLQRCDRHSPLRVVDCGTGSGAIALALATECPNWRILGIDKQMDCVACAQENSNRLELPPSQVSFVHQDWERLASEPGPAFDIMVANPPYIAEGDDEVDAQVDQYESHESLYSPESGYAHVHSLVALAQHVVMPGGRLFFEHGYRQGEKVRSMLQQRGFSLIATITDLSGKERVTTAVLPL